MACIDLYKHDVIKIIINMEMLGIEPRTLYMQSTRSTIEFTSPCCMIAMMSYQLLNS